MGLGKGCYGCSMTGVRRAIAFNKDAVIVFHSPYACGQIMREKESNAYNHRYEISDDETPLVTSDILDKDAIFGAQDKLAACLDEVIKVYNPKYIVVANSCVAGVIGDDVEAICQSVQTRTNTPILCVPCFGFMNGGYEEGLYQAGKLLIDRFVHPSEEREKKITLVGIVDPYKTTEHIFTQDILEQLGFEVACIFPGRTTVEEMEAIGKSQALLMCARFNYVHAPYVKLGKYLSEKTKLPIIDYKSDPVGYVSTLEWIEDLAKKLSVSKERTDAVLNSMKERFTQIIAKYKPRLAGKKVVIYVLRLPQIDIKLDWFLEILNLVGIETLGYVIDQRIDSEASKKFIEDLDLGLPVLSEDALNEADLVYTISMAKYRNMDHIPVPFATSPFGYVGLAVFYEKCYRKLMKFEHRGRE